MNKHTFSKIKKVRDIIPTVYKTKLFQLSSHDLPFNLHRDAFNQTKPTLLKAHGDKHNVLLLNDSLRPSNKSYLSRFPFGDVKQSNRNLVTYVSKRDSSYYTDKDKVVSITYEEIGLFPRSFSRVLDRFLKQLFSDVDNLVIQEYRFYRYLFLTTLKTIFILFFVPFLVNFAAKNYVVKPITEYFWNTSHPEIFLNSYEQKRAFAELEKFEEKIYFETLVESHSQHSLSFKTKENSVDNYYSNGSLHLQFTPESNAIKSQTQAFVGANTWNNVGDIKKKLELGSPSFFFPFFSIPPKGETEAFPPLGEEFAIPKGEGKKKGEQNFIPSGEVGSIIPDFSSVQAERKGSDITLGFEQHEYFGLNPSTLQKQKVEGQIPVEYKAKVETTRNNSIRKNKDISKIYQEKTIELATYYNNHSIEAITNFFADLLSLCTLLYLLITLEIQINITKSFLLEVFFGLDDSKKSLLILLITDLLVGYHSSNLWELFFEFIFNHYGIPESQTGIFLLVATLPVLLDVLFKYLIFRHLNRSSPATVATYQAIIE
uniref:Envelope membrane protein n=1 Tax=Yamagishiella unicocca TaxID=51707 RepID=A0A385KPJ1_9CHLO|nr:envelope membrane protein [Yamagishiella unicocca]AXZ97257.1 envelope membrane protein [Yamagishiella unicocca]